MKNVVLLDGSKACSLRYGRVDRKALRPI